MAGHIDFQNREGVATVTLNNPARFNAMSRSMWRELRDTFQRIQADESFQAVVVLGQTHFCAGGDISEYAEFRFQEDTLREFHENDVWGGLQAMLDCDVPIIAKIDGNCMGAGVEIASCCDIRISSERARFGAPIAKLGFPMAPREAALVARALGELTAREMLLSAAVLDAREMKQRGFLNQMVDTDALNGAVEAFIQRMRSLAPRAARLNKQSFRAISLVDIEQHATDLVATSYRYADSYEHREGIAAFTEKRLPRFIP